MKVIDPKHIKAVVITAAGLTFLLAVWGFFALNQKPEDATERYKIRGKLDIGAIAAMVGVMKEEPEFAFYFSALDEPTQQRLIRQAAEVILRNPSARELMERIKESYERIQALAATFYFMEYDENFALRPEQYPQLYGLFWDFLKGEFELAVLGVYYKVHYDAQFVFAWDDLTRQAAVKLRQLHGEMMHHQAKK
jgi:hypothetical protein